MKKVYLSAALFLVSSIIIGQANNAYQAMRNIELPNNTTETRPAYSTDDRAQGDIIVSDDFSDIANWTVSTDANGYAWQLVTSTPSDMGTYLGAMASTSASNGFAAFDAISLLLAGGYGTQDVLLEYNSVINCSGIPGVIIQFEQRYRAFNTDVTQFEVSGDNGATWTNFVVNDNVVTNDPAIQNTKVVNISAVAGNQSQVKVRFRWIGTDAIDFGAGYGWMIDDFSLAEAWDYETELISSFYRWGVGTAFPRGLDYHMIPTSQLSEVEFSAEIQNNGGLTQVGSFLAVDITEPNSNVVNLTSATSDILLSATDSLSTTDNFLPSALGTYNVAFSANQTNTDHDPSNNTFSTSFDVTEKLYSRDNGVASGSIQNVGSNDELELTIGNSMEIFADGEVGALEVVITVDAANAGQLIYGRVFLWDDNTEDYVEIAVTQEYEITSSDLGGPIRLYFDDALTVTAGQELLVAVAHYGGNPEVRFATAQSVANRTVWGYGADGNLFWLNSASAVMVRLDFSDFASVNESEVSTISVGQNVPNPFTNNSVITYNLNEASNVSMEIIDVTGKVVVSYNEGTIAAGEHNITVSADKLSDGVYFYTFKAGEYSVTKRMVVSK